MYVIWFGEVDIAQCTDKMSNLNDLDRVYRSIGFLIFSKVQNQCSTSIVDAGEEVVEIRKWQFLCSGWNDK